MYHFEKKTLKNLETFERKKNRSFLKKSLGSPMSLVQIFFFFFLKIFLFFGKILEILNFFLIFFWFCFFNIGFVFLIYIHKQSSLNAT